MTPYEEIVFHEGLWRVVRIVIIAGVCGYVIWLFVAT